MGEDGVERCFVQWRRCIRDDSSRSVDPYSFLGIDIGNPVRSRRMYTVEICGCSRKGPTLLVDLEPTASPVDNSTPESHIPL